MLNGKCKNNCKKCNRNGDIKSGPVCEVCGCRNMCVKCSDSGLSDGGCSSCLFWGVLTVLTFGLVLIVPLLFDGIGGNRCVAVCCRCGHIQKIRQ